MSDSLYAQCSAQAASSDTMAVIQCIADAIDAAHVKDRTNLHQWLLIVTGAMVFFMQAGFAMLCAGAIRIKNVQNTMLKNLLDACGAAIGFYCFGYAFAYGVRTGDKTTFIGLNNFFLMGDVDYAFWLYEFAFAATATTIVAGTLAERCQMAAYLCYSVLLGGFVYPIVAHAIWSSHGFISAFNANPLMGSGAIDFAGSGVVHTTGGSAALWATMILGPRRGRFYDSRGTPLAKPKPFPGHSVALQMLGTFILWFGWYGFNPGSALTLSNVQYTGKVAAQAAITTTLSTAAGAISAMFLHLWLDERRTGEAHFNVITSMNGALAGVVAVTGGCSVLEPWAAVIVGAVAGVIYLGGSNLLIKLRIDDAVDAIPVHLFPGIWGLFSIGLLANPSLRLASYGTKEHAGLFYELARGKADFTLLVNQILCILFILGWVFFLVFPFFIWLNYMGLLRSDSLEELVGLDISYHGGSAVNTEHVRSEYLDAYNRQKTSTKKRRRSSAQQFDDAPTSPEGAAEEAMSYDDVDMG